MSDVVNFDQVQEWVDEYSKIGNCRKKERLQNLIAMACMPLVKRMARTLARRSTDPVEDIIQIGSLGLIKAIRSYDPLVSRNFKSYTTYLITGEIRHYLRDKAGMIKAPRAIQELCYRVNKIALEMVEEFGEKPTNEQIADKMAMPVSKVKEAMDADRRKSIVSLDQLNLQSEDDFTNWTDKIPDVSYEDMQNSKEDRLMLIDCLKYIEPELKQIVEMVYFKDMSQLEIGELLGMSQMQVSRKLKKALNLLYDVIQERQSA